MRLTRRKILLGTGAGVIVGGGVAITPMLIRAGTLQQTPSRALVIQGDSQLPDFVDVVIIGAGIQGVCTALFLAERGMSVAICEKGEVAGEQSGRAYSQIISYGLGADVLPLIHRSKELWRGINARIGADTSYRTHGRLQTYEDDADLAAAQAWAKTAKEQYPALQVRFIEGDELRQRIPGARTPWKMGGLEEDAGSVDPETGAPVIARYLKTQGVKLLTQCAVRGLETQAGAVSGVVTEKGIIRAPIVVLAGGLWSRLFLGNLGLDLPTLPVYASQQRITGVEGAPRGNGQIGSGISYREQADGTYASAPRISTISLRRESFALAGDFLPWLFHKGGMPLYLALNRDLINSFQTLSSWRMDEVTPFEQIRIAAPEPDHEFLDLALERLRKEFPAFEKSQVIERWGGCLSMASDILPVIGTVESHPGLILNTAHAFGITQGPAAGECVADLITGDKPKVDLSAYQLSRFSA